MDAPASTGFKWSHHSPVTLVKRYIEEINIIFICTFAEKHLFRHTGKEGLYLKFKNRVKHYWNYLLYQGWWFNISLIKISAMILQTFKSQNVKKEVYLPINICLFAYKRHKDRKQRIKSLNFFKKLLLGFGSMEWLLYLPAARPCDHGLICYFYYFKSSWIHFK